MRSFQRKRLKSSLFATQLMILSKKANSAQHNKFASKSFEYSESSLEMILSITESFKSTFRLATGASVRIN
jgi:hypothetical protein